MVNYELTMLNRWREQGRAGAAKGFSDFWRSTSTKKQWGDLHPCIYIPPAPHREGLRPRGCALTKRTAMLYKFTAVIIFLESTSTMCSGLVSSKKKHFRVRYVGGENSAPYINRNIVIETCKFYFVAWLWINWKFSSSLLIRLCLQ